MSERARYIVAGAIMAATASTVLDLVDKDWRKAAWLVMGFVMGAIWCRCVGPDLDALKGGAA